MVFALNIVVTNITGFLGFRAKNKIKRKENMSEIKKKTKKKETMEEVTIIDLDKFYSLLLDPEVQLTLSNTRQGFLVLLFLNSAKEIEKSKIFD